MEVRKYRRTTRFILLCVAILLGLGWARKAPILPPLYVWLLGAFALFSFRKARVLSLYAVLFFGFALGWWRGGIFMAHVRELAGISKQKVVLVGTALSDGTYDDKSQLSFDMGNLQMEEPYAKQLVGKVGVSGYGESMIYRGDQVRVSGKFYPARGSVVAYLSYSDLEAMGRSHSVIFSITRRFAAGLQNALPEPLASFSMGILVGQRNTLPENITNILSAIGLTHIIAVSGYNLTIMMRATRKLFGKRSKFQVYVGSQALVLSFLLVTGMSASIVRAAIISSLSLGAAYYGRTIKPLLLILFTAALTALWNPLYIWSDLGWYLSFLAFFGVLILGPLVRGRLFNGAPRGLVGEMVTETMSAQVATLPLILYIFKTSSFVALPANVLVVPLIPLAMLLSFMAGLTGMLLVPIAGWVAWPARLLLTYILDIATLFARVPHMGFAVTVSLAAMLIMYGAIILVLFTLWRTNTRNDKITEVEKKTEDSDERTFQVVYNQTPESSY
jgi:competence protein ComEC